MKILTVALASAILIASTLSLTACHHEKDGPGPAQQAGKKIDDAMSQAGAKITDTSKDLKKSIQSNPSLQKLDKKMDSMSSSSSQ